MCCNSGLAKCCLVVVNIIFFVLGGVVLVVGFLAKYAQDVLIRAFSYVPEQLMNDIDEAWDLPSLLAEAAVMLILVGVFIFVIGFLGCCGGLSENKCMLVSYMVVIGCIVFFELITIIMLSVKSKTSEDALISGLQSSIQKNYFDSAGGLTFDDDGNFQFAIRPIKLAWDGIQVGLSCCGALNASDYVNANFDGTYNLTVDGEFLEISNAQVPLSCCSFVNKEEYEKDREDFHPDSVASSQSLKLKLMKTSSQVQVAVTECLQNINADYVHQKGCYKTFMDLIEKYWAFVIGFLVFIMSIKVFALLCAGSIMRHQTTDKEEYNKLLLE